jgi:two-component system, LuxR family, response regulator FixJ
MTQTPARMLPTQRSLDENKLVLIIEDDTSLRFTLSTVLNRHGFVTQAFSDPAAFFEWLERTGKVQGCLLLDMRLPGMSGLEVQNRLDGLGLSLPIVFISGSSQIGEAITGLKNGATDFLLKPFDQTALVDAVKKSLKKIADPTSDNAYRLSKRERLVLDYVSKGWRSEQIAQTLGLSVRTIKMHRSNIIHKTGANTMTEAVLMVLNGTSTQ